MTHEDSLRQPPFEANCLNWILGHLISSRTYPLRFVGEEPVWTDQQRSRYRHESPNISPDEANIIPLADLCALMNQSHIALIRGLNRLTYEDMCRPAVYKENTLGDSLAYFHFHEAHHVGQILYLGQYAGYKGAWLS